MNRRRGRCMPVVAIAQLCVRVLPAGGRIVQIVPVGWWFRSPSGPRRSCGSGSEGHKSVGAAAAAGGFPAGGELAGDFGCDVAEEMRHGKERAADNAGGEFGGA